MSYRTDLQASYPGSASQTLIKLLLFWSHLLGLLLPSCSRLLSQLYRIHLRISSPYFSPSTPGYSYSTRGSMLYSSHHSQFCLLALNCLNLTFERAELVLRYDVIY
jgi:hypothetical protein